MIQLTKMSAEADESVALATSNGSPKMDVEVASKKRSLSLTAALPTWLRRKNSNDNFQKFRGNDRKMLKNQSTVWTIDLPPSTM